MADADDRGFVTSRCPGPTIQDIVRRDEAVPDILREMPAVDLGSEDIPFSRYTSRDFHELEVERMWSRVWQWTCREEHIAEPGDFFTYDIGPHSVIVVRTTSGEIKAFYNACLHRGTRLKPCDTQGNSDSIRCPFHGWTWNLDGSLADVPCRWDFPQVRDEDFSLPEVRVAIWNGFVFICMSEEAPPLEDYLGVLPEHFANWNLARRYVAVHAQKELNCNWKIAHEAFMEAYHVPDVHPQLSIGTSDVNMQYDILDENVSRYYSVTGVPSPTLAEPPSEQDVFDSMFVGSRLGAGENALKPGQTARSKMVEMVRQSLEAGGVDTSGYTDTEVVDTIGYGLFPNTVFFIGLATSMVYRFRPLGNDPTKSLFDLLILRPIPDGDGVEAPEPAEPVLVKEHESYSVVDGLDAQTALVYDQDTDNMRWQQEGAAISHKHGATLSRYQESRIRHLHKTLEAYCRPPAGA